MWVSHIVCSTAANTRVNAHWSFAARIFDKTAAVANKFRQVSIANRICRQGVLSGLCVGLSAVCEWSLDQWSWYSHSQWRNNTQQSLIHRFPKTRKSVEKGRRQWSRTAIALDFCEGSGWRKFIVGLHSLFYYSRKTLLMFECVSLVLGSAMTAAKQLSNESYSCSVLIRIAFARLWDRAGVLAHDGSTVDHRQFIRYPSAYQDT